MNLLFRLGQSRRFISVSDPNACYDYACGRCEYPLLKDDRLCPRCRRDLEWCPVCSQRTQLIGTAPVVDPETGAKTCPVCHVRRIPFGRINLDRLDGMFCGNIYGCPAGGLLLMTDEYAVLPSKAQLCPICRRESLPPRRLDIFTSLIRSCPFCYTLFASVASWLDGRSGSSVDHKGEWAGWVQKLQHPIHDRKGPCPLCGRNDEHAIEKIGPGGFTPRGNLDSLGLTTGQYLRVVEMAKALVFHDADDDAFESVYRIWVAPQASGVAGVENPRTAGDAKPSDVSMEVSRAVQVLLEGTLQEDVINVLQPRVDAFQHLWMEAVLGGLNYKLQSQETKAKGHKD